MALPRLDIRTRLEYQRLIGSDPTKTIDFNVVWTRVTAIDLTGLVNDYNSYERTNDEAGLTSLDGIVTASINSMQSLIKSYPDKDVNASANDMIVVLYRIKREIDKQLSIIRPSTKGGISKVIHFIKAKARTLSNAYSKINKPADDLYNFTKRTIESGGENIFSGRHKK